MQPELNFSAARQRIQGHTHETDLVVCPVAGLLLKCEHRQVTGSFKVRGALNKLLGLSQADRERGIVAASAGNHGLGVAFAAGIVGARASVVVPSEAVRAKVDGIRSLGGEVIQVPGGFAAAEAYGLALASEREAVWVSPYNDRAVIEGQGTLGLEIVEQAASLPDPQSELRVYVPVSGGGLIAGVGLAVKQQLGSAYIIGVQTEAAPYMAVYFDGGDPAAVRETPTLADGLAGPVESGSMTFDWLHRAADEMQLVGEGAILRALDFVWRTLGEVVEPSAAVPLAAALADRWPGRKIVVLSGGNASDEVKRRVAGTGAGPGDL